MMLKQRRQVWFDLTEHTAKPRFVDRQELPNWQEGPEIVDYVKQMANEGWELVVHGAGHEFIFEREVF